MSKYKIVNKPRFYTVLFILTLLICIVFFTTVADAKEYNQEELVPVYVVAGDTLWQLSSIYADEGMDIRDYINEVIRINDLKSVNIVPGQVINFPK